MNYAMYVGRVGALAVALGIGIAIANTPVVAWAGPETGDDPSLTSAQSPEPKDEDGDNASDNGPLDGSGDSDDSVDSDDSDDPTGGMQVASSGGEITSTTPGSAGAKAADEDADAAPPKRRLGAKSDSDSLQASWAPKQPKRSLLAAPAPPSRNAEGLDAKPRASALRVTPSDDHGDQVVQPTRPVAEIAPQVRKAAASPKVTASVVAAPEPEPPTLMSRVLSVVTLAPAAGDAPPVGGESPLFLSFMAAGRRVSQKASLEDESSLRVADSTETSLMMMTVAANSAPQASPTMGVPNQTTGAVTVRLNATDADGNPLSYSISSQPSSGSVQAVAVEPGRFTYTPTAAARVRAGTTAGADFDTFTVMVSDEQVSTPVTVQVPVLPAVLVNNNTTGSTQASPYGVAIVGNRAYVANQGTNTVTVIDATTGAAVGKPIVVGSAPTGVAASPDGSKVYVANRNSGTITVIRTSDNKVVGTPITVGTQPESITFSTDGSKAYVTNYGSNSVSVIDTGTARVVSTITNVGSNPRGIAYVQTANGPRVYVLNRTAGTVSVINANTNTLVDTNPIRVGTNPEQIAVSPDGSQVYVTNSGSNSVSVINTATNSLVGEAIPVGSTPAGVTVSPDGSILYVANSDDLITIVDTKTRTVIGTMQIDTAPEVNLHMLAVRSDGGLVVTDMSDRLVRIVNYQRGNTAPVAIDEPSHGVPHPISGAVSGSLNVKDWDGDTVTYTVPVQPASGTVTVTAAGKYTYTPTAAARDQAAQSPNEDIASFSVIARDGTSATSIPVSVVIAPTPAPSQDIPVTSREPITVGANPAGVAVAGNDAYVVNTEDYWSGTVTVIDTATNRIVGDPIPVGYGATRVVASPDGDRVYVATAYEVSVIDAATQQIIATVPVPTQCWECYTGIHDIAVSPDGTRVYAAVLDSTVSVIDTDPNSLTYHQVISTSYVPYWEGDIEVVSPDGSRLYATEGYGGDSIYVTDTATMQSERIHVGLVWDQNSMRSETTYGTNNVAVNSNGTRAYVTARILVVERGVGGQTSGWFIGDSQGRTWLVTDEYSVVSVIDTDPESDTYNTEIATILVPDGASDVAVSTDGSRAYVTHSDGKTVTVIDTATNAVLGTFTTDPTGGGPQSITVAPNGTIYIADPGDNKVYAVTVGGTTSPL